MYRTTWRNFDFVLLLVALALVSIGGVMIYSSYGVLQLKEEPLLDCTIVRQGIFAVVGLALYVLVAALDYHVLISLYRWVYLGVLGLLGFTLLAGQTLFGARSWLDLGAVWAQPSELCKVLMIVVFARLLGGEPEELESPLPFLASGLSVVCPMLLIYLQPDFGTALIILATWLGMAFLAGVRWRHMFLAAGAGAIATPVVWFRLRDYMRDRVLQFFFPGQDASEASYNITQALISIGSGGWWGKGLLRGTQSQLYFLRVRHTDFIFSVLGEELGFAGSMLLLVLFTILILRLVRAAALARDGYGRLIAGGVASMLLIQTFVNLAMNANLLPVTGLPLPLVSYGGSSLVTTLLALGLAQSVVMRRKGGLDQELL